MKLKDERLRIISDLLSGIRVLKLYGWEESQEKATSRVRDRELKQLFISFLYDVLLAVTFFDAAPVIVSTRSRWPMFLQNCAQLAERFGDVLWFCHCRWRQLDASIGLCDAFRLRHGSRIHVQNSTNYY